MKISFRWLTAVLFLTPLVALAFEPLFDARIDIPAGANPFSVFSADLDGGGDIDLAVTSGFGSTVTILKNNGDGTFQTGVNFFAGADPYSIFCADLDGD